MATNPLTPNLAIRTPDGNETPNVPLWLSYLAADVDAVFGAWKTYNPALVGMTASVIRGRYVKFGKTVHGHIGLTVATISGPLGFAIPVPAAASILTIPVGIAQAQGATVSYGAPFLASTTGLQVRHTDSGVWDNSRPFGWAPGNTIGIEFTYEAA